VSIQDGLKIGEMVKVTVLGFLHDGCHGTTESGNPTQRIIRLDYGRGESFYVCCDQPGVTITKVQ